MNYCILRWCEGSCERAEGPPVGVDLLAQVPEHAFDVGPGAALVELDSLGVAEFKLEAPNKLILLDLVCVPLPLELVEDALLTGLVVRLQLAALRGGLALQAGEDGLLLALPLEVAGLQQVLVLAADEVGQVLHLAADPGLVVREGSQHGLLLALEVGHQLVDRPLHVGHVDLPLLLELLVAAGGGVPGVFD
jgi:hypothetical protein